jgi:hypothetical protein
MAWRIQDSVIRGEIDNRVKGYVHGKLWLAGQDEPMILKLTGNCHSDLAGCRLEFQNRLAPVPLRRDARLATVQEGSAGDITASRKVRVFDVPLADAMEQLRRGEQPPEHLANCLYVEWFSELNGRVVIESTDFDLVVSPPEWRLTPAEEQARASQAAAGMEAFLRRLTEAIERHERAHPDHGEEWDEHDYEQFLRECDARTEKYAELLEKYGDSEEAEAIIAREMGWDQEPETGEEDEEAALDVEDLNRLCEDALNEPRPGPDPHREGIDWIRTANGDLRHPLQHRAFEASIAFRHRCQDLGLDAGDDDDLLQATTEFQICSVKLGGALNGIARGRHFTDPAFTVANLKRALHHLHLAQAGLENVALKQRLPAPLLESTRREMFEIREGILGLMDEFRGRG